MEHCDSDVVLGVQADLIVHFVFSVRLPRTEWVSDHGWGVNTFNTEKYTDTYRTIDVYLIII